MTIAYVGLVVSRNLSRFVLEAHRRKCRPVRSLGNALSEDLIQIMKSAKECADSGSNYRPENVSVLMVPESPPSSKGFFYFEKTIGKGVLAS